MFAEIVVIAQFVMILALTAALIVQSVLHGRAMRLDHDNVADSWKRAAIESARAYELVDESIAKQQRAKAGVATATPAANQPITHHGARTGIPRSQLATNGMG